MTIELARRRFIAKPWGARNLKPWDHGAHGDCRIGEVWYERSDTDTAAGSLLLKLLFTTEQLSIQVHPDDTYAKAMGLASGKTEAWYILQAAQGAQVALGLKRVLSASQLREAVSDGSLVNLILWHNVSAGDALLVPAGTIHSLGAGLVIAEIQQRSDVTFRLLDPGRDRGLHIDRAIAVARAELAPEQSRPHRLDDERTLLVSNSHFVLERLDLPGYCERSLQADHETWLLVVGGHGRAASFEVGLGSGLFTCADQVALSAGAEGMAIIVAYAGGVHPAPYLLHAMEGAMAMSGCTPGASAPVNETLKETR